MRITNNMLINNVLLNVSNNLNRTQKYQSQLATGKKITMPSDDPIVASKALKLRTDVAEIMQYRRNADDATSWMEITEATLAQIGEVIHRFREISAQAANGTNSEDDIDKIRTEAEEQDTAYPPGQHHLCRALHILRLKTDKPCWMKRELNINIKYEKINFEIGIGDDINVNVPGGSVHGGDRRERRRLIKTLRIIRQWSGDHATDLILLGKIQKWRICSGSGPAWAPG